jgi:WhiB family redox-sensing transcriptional regulator
VSDDWRTRAACRGKGTTLFFASTALETGIAQAVCRACPVRDPCLDYGTRTGSVGTWGGVTLRGSELGTAGLEHQRVS